MSLVNKTMQVDAITVGTRIRQDAGDLASLADSIARHGLLHPIVIAPTDELLAGWRRLEAVKLLGWTEVPVRVAVDVADVREALAIESAENSERKDFTHSEAVAMARAIESVEKPKAKERQGRPGKPRSARSAESSEQAPRPRDVAAEATGRSHDTLRKASAVVDTAEDESQPAEVRSIATEAREEMDRTGKVDPAHRKVQEAIGKNIAKENPELVESQAGREASGAVRKAWTTLKHIDPEAAGRGWGRSNHVDLHVEALDALTAWLATYRRHLVGLTVVKGGRDEAAR